MPRQSTANVVYDDSEDTGSSQEVVIGFQSIVVVGDIKDSEDGASISFKGAKEVTVVGHADTVICPLDPDEHYLLPRHEVQMGDVFRKKKDGKLYVHTGRRTCPPSEVKPDQQTW